MGLYDFTSANEKNKLQNRIRRLEKAFSRQKGGILQNTSSGFTPIPADAQSISDAKDGQVLTYNKQKGKYLPV